MHSDPHAISLRTLGFDTDILEYRHPDGTYRCTVRHIGGAIFHLTQEGYVDDESVVRMIAFFSAIRRELDARFGIKTCVVINEIPKVTGGSVYSKRYLKKVFSTWPGLTMIGVGGSGLVNIVGKILALLVPSVSIRMVGTMEEALSLARACDPTRNGATPAADDGTIPTLPDLYRERFAQLLDAVGGVTWDEEFEPKMYDVPEDDPFSDLFAAIRSMHKDVREIVQRLETARKEAEEATRRKDRLITDVSHELRSPLAGIILMSDMLALARDPQETRQYAEQIHETALRMSRIVEEILADALVGAEKSALTSCRFDLVERLAPLFDQFAIEAVKKDLRFERILPPERRLPVNGDPLKVLQIVTNLLSNAVKYTDTGTVRVSVSARDLDGRTREAIIEVADTGIGMSDDEQATLFSRFSRTPATALRRGIGLGLSIAHELAGLMGGDIAVKSTPGNGSVFTFSFPFTLDGDRVTVTPKEESGKREPPSTRPTSA